MSEIQTLSPKNITNPRDYIEYMKSHSKDMNFGENTMFVWVPLADIIAAMANPDLPTYEPFLENPSILNIGNDFSRNQGNVYTVEKETTEGPEALKGIKKEKTPKINENQRQN